MNKEIEKMLGDEDLDITIGKARIEHEEVFLMEIEDEGFVFRTLTRKEYDDILKITEDIESQEVIICNIGTIYPKKFDFESAPPGYVSRLSLEIINQSGFGTVQKSHEYFDEYKRLMGGFELQAEAAIQAAFPGIKEEEMRNWTVNKLMRMLAKAEWVLNNIHGYPIEFQDLRNKEAEGEQEEEKEKLSYREIGNILRKQGIDPMMHFSSMLFKYPLPVIESPFIAGTEYWRKKYD
jgi:hypothetical protein